MTDQCQPNELQGLPQATDCCWPTGRVHRACTHPLPQSELQQAFALGLSEDLIIDWFLGEDV